MSSLIEYIDPVIHDIKKHQVEVMDGTHASNMILGDEILLSPLKSKGGMASKYSYTVTITSETARIYMVAKKHFIN